MDKSKVKRIRVPYFFFTKRGDTKHAVTCDFKEQIELIKKRKILKVTYHKKIVVKLPFKRFDLRK